MVTDPRYALVRQSDGRVLNVCRWDGVTPWNHLPPGVQALACPDDVGPGWSLSGSEWLPPEPPIEPPPEPSPEE